MKLLLIGILACYPLFATAPTCFASGGGATVVPNVTYDATPPSQQTNAGNTGGIIYPTGMAATAQPDMVIFLYGTAWTDQNTNACTEAQVQAQKLWIPRGWSVWVPYLPLAAQGSIAATHSIGDKTGFVVSGQQPDNFPWPNSTQGGAATCVDGSCVTTLPIAAMYGTFGSDQELISITSQSGGNGLTFALTVGLTKNHLANEPIYIVASEHPAQVSALASFLRFVAANAGVNYPGNPQRIHLACGSSGTAACATLVNINNPSLCLSSCSPLSNWFGANMASGTNTNTNYHILDVINISFAASFTWMWDQGYDGCGTPCTPPGVDKIAIQELLGALIDTDTGARAFSTAQSPNAFVSGSTYTGGFLSTTGSTDQATSCALYNTPVPFFSCPSPGNMFAQSGYPYLLFTGAAGGHGGNCNVIPGPCSAVTMTLENNSSPSGSSGASSASGGSGGIF